MAGDAKEDAKDDAVQAAGWKAYDAFVRVANESANQLYANPTVRGNGGARRSSLACRRARVTDSMVSAMFRELLAGDWLADSHAISRG